MTSTPCRRNSSLLHLKCCSSALFIYFYALSLVYVFHFYLEPSLVGDLPIKIAADSTTYLGFAELITQSGGLFTNNSVPLLSLSGNFIGPVIIASLLNSSHWLIAIFNVALFTVSYVILIKNFPVHKNLFLCALLLNPLMYVSLLSINKEIMGFFVVSLFACFLNNNKKIGFGIVSLLLSFFVRWELTFVMLMFLCINNKHFIFCKIRVVTFIMLILVITMVYPSVSSFVDTALSSQEMEGNTIATLTEMQKHYKFFIAAIPKMLFNTVGMAFNWLSTFYIDKTIIITNIIIGSEICNLVVMMFLLLKKRVSLGSNNIYFYLFSLLIFSLTPFAQSRYMFPFYVLLCIDLCKKPAMLNESGVEVDSCNMKHPAAI